MLKERRQARNEHVRGTLVKDPWGWRYCLLLTMRLKSKGYSSCCACGHHLQSHFLSYNSYTAFKESSLFCLWPLVEMLQWAWLDCWKELCGIVHSVWLARGRGARTSH